MMGAVGGSQVGQVFTLDGFANFTGFHRAGILLTMRPRTEFAREGRQKIAANGGLVPLA